MPLPERCPSSSSSTKPPLVTIPENWDTLDPPSSVNFDEGEDSDDEDSESDSSCSHSESDESGSGSETSSTCSSAEDNSDDSSSSSYCSDQVLRSDMNHKQRDFIVIAVGTHNRDHFLEIIETISVTYQQVQ